MAQFDAYKEQSPLLIIGGFFLLYVVVTALSLPGAAILTLASGALFGLVQGLIIASFASSIGATLAFLASRYLLRDTIKQRFPERLAAIDSGVEKEGGFYFIHIASGPCIPILFNQLAHGCDCHQVMDLLLGQPSGYAGGDFRIC